MVEEKNQQNKLKRLKVLSVLLNRAGWTFLIVWLVGLPLLLPSLLPTKEDQRGSEGLVNIGAMNHAQKFFFLESGQFADSMNDLGLGITSQTENYDYSIILSKQKNVVFSLAIPRTSDLRMFVGVVASFEDPTTKENTTKASLCIAECLGTVTESAIDKYNIAKYKQYLQHRSIAINSDDDVKCDFGDGTVKLMDTDFFRHPRNKDKASLR